MQRRGVGALLPQRAETAEAAGRPDPVRAGGDPVEERVVAAGQAQRAPTGERATGEDRAVAGDARHPPRRDVDHAGARQLGVGAARRGGRRPVLAGGRADARQSRAGQELPRRDPLEQGLREGAVRGHAVTSYDAGMC